MPRLTFQQSEFIAQMHSIFSSAAVEETVLIKLSGAPGAGVGTCLNVMLDQEPLKSRGLYLTYNLIHPPASLHEWVEVALDMAVGRNLGPKSGIPAHVRELLRIRGVDYLVVEDFHDACHVAKGGPIRVLSEFKELRSQFPLMKLVISETSGMDSSFELDNFFRGKYKVARLAGMPFDKGYLDLLVELGVPPSLVRPQVDKDYALARDIHTATDGLIGQTIRVVRCLLDKTSLKERSLAEVLNDEFLRTLPAARK